MDKKRIAQALLKIARELTSESRGSGVDGMTKIRARKTINKQLYQYTKGIYNDETWRQVQRVWDELENMGLDWHMVRSYYDKNGDGRPFRKTWYFVVNFIDNKGKKIDLYGTLVAAGAGSVGDPLDKYDVSVYVS